MLVLLLGCTKTEITYTPDIIEWGEINFYDDMPENGYDEQNIVFQNIGKKQISLLVSGFNSEYFCIKNADTDFIEIDDLYTNQIFEVSVSVCDYMEENGQRDEYVEGQFEIFDETKDSKKKIGEINWSFTPVIHILEDSG